MAEETIPLEFTAVDRLTATVKKMTGALSKLVAQQDASTKATGDNAKAQDDAADSMGKLEKVLSIARNGAELVGMAWEKLSGVYEGTVELVGTSLSKWDEQVKRSGKAASSLGSVSDASARAEKAQDKLLRSMGRVIESTGLAQIGYDIKRDALLKLDSLLKEYDDDIASASQRLAGDFVGALREGATWVSENAETVARLSSLVESLAGVLGFGAKSIEIVGRAAQVWISAELAIATGAVERLIAGLEVLIETAGLEVPQALEDVRLGMEAMNKSAKTSASDGLDKLVKASNEGADDLVAIADNFGRVFSSTSAELSGTTDKIRKAAEGADKYLAAQEKKLEEAGKKKDGRAKRERDEQLEAERRQAQILRLDLAITEARLARNEPLAIEIERSKALLEAAQSTIGLKSKELAGLTISLSYRQAELDAAEKLKAITAEQWQTAKDAGEAARANYVALTKASLDFQASTLRGRGEGEDATQAAQLERQAALLDLAERLRTIEDAKLRAATERLELQRIEYDFETKLYEAGQARHAMTMDLIDATAAQWESVTSNFGSLASEALAQDMEGWQARIDANADYMAGLEELGALDEATKSRLTAENEALAEEMERTAAAAERQAQAFQRAAQAAGAMAQAVVKLSLNNKTLAQSHEEVGAALQAGVGLGSSLVAAYTDNVKTRAKWDAAFNAAAAIAATALSFVNPAFIPVAVGHGIAAAQFGLIAGGVIGGGGGGGSISAGGGGVAGQAAGGVTVDLDRERRLTAESIAESLGAQGGGGGVVINVDFGNALIASTSPQAAQEIADLLEPELQRRFRR